MGRSIHDGDQSEHKALYGRQHDGVEDEYCCDDTTRQPDKTTAPGPKTICAHERWKH
jgi:hypothetical protein